MAHNVFGESLETLMQRPGEEKIPRLIKRLLAWINANALGLEGLFRVSAGVKELDNLKMRFNNGEDVPLDNLDAHLIAGALKAYFIELPEPLLTFDLYDEFIDSADAPEQKQRLHEIVNKLPETNRVIAQVLFLLLSRVADRSGENKMTTTNLAIIFGQILLRPRVESLESLLRHSPKITSLLKSMVDDYPEIFLSNREEALLIEDLVGGTQQPGGPVDGDQSDQAGAAQQQLQQPLSPEQQKLRNIKLTVEEAIAVVLERLDSMSKELNGTTSLEETIEIAKRIRTAKRILFSQMQQAQQLQ